jgi:hypothetical protein
MWLINSQREQAEEGQYIRKRELEQLKKAQEKLKAAQDEVVSYTLSFAIAQTVAVDTGRSAEEGRLFQVN